MICEVSGNLITFGADLLCHQVNYHGVMGAGVALAIASKLLDQQQYGAYVNQCELFGRSALGTIQFLTVKRESADAPIQYVANLFCQDGYYQADGSLTDYEAMRICLQQVERFALNCACVNGRPLTVALPKMIGCGLAGGDWEKVMRIISRVFEASPVQLTIVSWDRE